MSGVHDQGWMHRHRRKLGLGVVALVVGTVASVAVAQWLVDGSGSGRARGGEAQPLTLSPVEVGDALFPGGTASVATRVSNPNPFPVVITQFVQDGDITSDTTGCDPSSHSVTFATQDGSWMVAGNSDADISLADAVEMGLDAADACQGAVFTVPLAVVAGAGSNGDPIGTTTTTTENLTTWFADADGDAYGDPDVTQSAGTQPDGFVDNNFDCDDTNSAINPDATEVANGVDDDCDGETDEGLGVTWFADDDGDSFGDAGSTTVSDTQPVAFVDNDADCDDTNSAINPAATETANGVDDNCDGAIDEGLDSDGDGVSNTFEYGDGGFFSPLDTDADATPDYLDVDSDNDGFLDEEEPYIDAPDGDGLLNPYDNDANDNGITDDVDPSYDQYELCDGIDNDADGDIDEADTDIGPGGCVAP